MAVAELFGALLTRLNLNIAGSEHGYEFQFGNVKSGFDIYFLHIYMLFAIP